VVSLEAIPHCWRGSVRRLRPSHSLVVGSSLKVLLAPPYRGEGSARPPPYREEGPSGVLVSLNRSSGGLSLAHVVQVLPIPSGFTQYSRFQRAPALGSRWLPVRRLALLATHQGTVLSRSGSGLSAADTENLSTGCLGATPPV